MAAAWATRNGRGMGGAFTTCRAVEFTRFRLAAAGVHQRHLRQQLTEGLAAVGAEDAVGLRQLRQLRALAAGPQRRELTLPFAWRSISRLNAVRYSKKPGG